MADNSFTVIFWNTWFEIQNGKRDSGQLVCARLEKLIDEFSPDVFGLNEVYKDSTGKSDIIDCLTKNNYVVNYTPLITMHNDDHVGNLLASKQKPIRVKDREFGKGYRSRIKIYKEYSPKFTEADLLFNNSNVKIVLTHLGVLVPVDWKMHIKHRKDYDSLIRKLDPTNLIIGGDFNETKYMLPWLRMPKYFQRKTGTLLNPTWQVNGKSRLLFTNFDNLVYSKKGNLQLEEFKVLPKYPSDHAPLLARFIINK